MNVRRLLIAAIVVMQSVIAHAQWINQRSPNTPRLPDGTPNLAAPVPRAIDGKPDLSGVWEVVGDRVMPTDGRIRSKYVYDIASDLPGGAPFQPGRRRCTSSARKALASVRQRSAVSRMASPTRC